MIEAICPMTIIVNLFIFFNNLIDFKMIISPLK